MHPSEMIFEFHRINFLVASNLPFCYIIKMLPITIRKRTLHKADLELIQYTVECYWDKGRTQIFTPFTSAPSQYIHLAGGPFWTIISPFRQHLI